MQPISLDYRRLRAALERLPPGPEHDRAVHELRASLRALPAAEVERMFMDLQRASLARRAREESPPKDKAAA